MQLALHIDAEVRLMADASSTPPTLLLFSFTSLIDGVTTVGPRFQM